MIVKRYVLFFPAVPPVPFYLFHARFHRTTDHRLFCLVVGEYSGKPTSKMAAIVSGGVVSLLLGSIVRLGSSTVEYDVALSPC